MKLLQSPLRSIVTCAQATEQGPGGSRRQHRPSVHRNNRRPSSQTERGVTSTNAASATAIVSPLTTANADAAYSPHRALQMLSRYRALVVDAAYRPIEVVNWQRALCMDILEKADVLEYYDTTISSSRADFYLPAVMKARWYNSRGNRRGLKVALSRRNILLRDDFTCQYCQKNGKSGNVLLTLDHVMPSCKGGDNSWGNLVTACNPCNSKKGDKTLKQLKWKLLKEPKEPSPWELDLVLSSIGAGEIKNVPEEWSSYLFYGEKR